MSGFAHDVAGGNGDLVITSVQSPNFVHGVSGWRIGKDGSAEFQNVILPGSAKGITATFSATEPPSPNVGDLWYNTANGLLLSQWDGTDWVPFSIGAGAIADNAITAGQTAIGDTLNPNPYFAGGSTASWTPSNGANPPAGVATTGIAYPFAGELTTPAGQFFPAYNGPFFAVNEGDPVQVNGWYNCNADAQLAIGFYDSSSSFVSETITVVPATSGAWVYASISGTVPTGAGVTQAGLSVVVNNASTTGAEVVQATGLTVQGKVNGGLIESGTTITGPLISAGTFMGSVFEGTNWLENSNGQFMYSGTPALGNLLLSIAPTSTADPFGNSVTAGVWVYFAGSKIGLFNQGSSPAVLCEPNSTTATVDGGMFAFVTAPGVPAEQLWLVLTSGKESGNADAAIQLTSASADNTLGAQMAFEFGGTVAVTLTTAGFVADTWHNITLDSGWTSVVTPQYRRLPDGNIQVRGQASHAGVTAATNINNSNPLAAAYRPAANRVYRTPASADAAGTVAMGTGGVFQMRASGFTATQVFMDGIYAL